MLFEYKHKKGWVLSVSKAFLLYYDKDTNNVLSYRAQVAMGYGDETFATILAESGEGSVSMRGYEIVKFNEMFANPHNPSEDERMMFELECGIPYIDEEFLDTMALWSKEYWYGID